MLISLREYFKALFFMRMCTDVSVHSVSVVYLWMHMCIHVRLLSTFNPLLLRDLAYADVYTSGLLLCTTSKRRYFLSPTHTMVKLSEINWLQYA